MKIISLFAVMSMALLTVKAQYSIEVREASESFSTGSQNALNVAIYERDVKDVEGAWKKRLGKMGNSSTKKGEIQCDDCKDKKGMGENTFDVYSKVTEGKEGEVVLSVAIDLGGAYMSSSAHGDQYKWFFGVVKEFAIEQTKEGIGSQVKEEQKVLADLVKEKEDLEKDTEQQKKDIEDYKKKIEEAEKQINENEKNKETKEGEIKDQEKVVEDIKAKQAAVK